MIVIYWHYWICMISCDLKCVSVLLCKKGILVILTYYVIFELKRDLSPYYDMWWVFMWYIVDICSETIVHSLVRSVFAKVGFCSVLSILRASFGIWWVRKLIWEIRRYFWVIRGRAGLGVRFRGLRFRDLGTRVAWGVCHVLPREACQDFVVTNKELPLILDLVNSLNFDLALGWPWLWLWGWPS